MWYNKPNKQWKHGQELVYERVCVREGEQEKEMHFTRYIKMIKAFKYAVKEKHFIT